MDRTYSLRRWYFALPALALSLGVLLPILYLVIRAGEGNPESLLRLVFRTRTFILVWNTFALTAGVLATTLAIGFSLAWLSVRTHNNKGRWLVALGILPLGIPGYVMAYLLLGLTGEYGFLYKITGVSVPVLSGYFGALIALSLHTFPYVFLNVRSALSGLDETVEESARALGMSRRQVMRHVTIPQLRPALLAASLVIILHTIGDFGVVSLMRFETISYSIYIQYAAAFDRSYAAALALILLAITALVLWAEFKLLKGHVYHRTWSSSRPVGPTSLGRWRVIAIVMVLALAVGAIVIPISTLLYWSSGSLSADWADAVGALWSSASAAAPAAVLSVLIATPVVLLSLRRPSRLHRSLERVAYLGYAMPPLALALALIFLSIRSFPGIYQTLFLLVAGYTIHFAAEAVGPIRTTLYQVPQRLEEASISLGWKPLESFLKVTLPNIKKGIIVGGALVFLSAMKELPLTLLLAPLGFETLATNVWTYAAEAQFTRAAPFALFIILFSLLLSYLILINSRSAKSDA